MSRPSAKSNGATAIKQEKNLQDDLQSKSVTIENTTSALNELNKKLKCSTRDSKRKRLKVKRLAIKCEELDIELANSLNHITELNNTISEKGRQIDKMKKSIETLSEKNKSYELKVAEQVTSLKSNVTDLEMKIGAKEEECNALRKELERVNGILLGPQSEDNVLKEAYHKLLDDYQRMNDEHDELKSNLDKVRQSVRAEYDEILKKMKAQMESNCTQALKVKDEKHAKELRILQETNIQSTPDRRRLSFFGRLVKKKPYK